MGFVGSILDGRPKMRAACPKAGWCCPDVTYGPTDKRREPINSPNRDTENDCRGTESQEQGHSDTEQPRGRYANRGRKRGDTGRYTRREHEKRVRSTRVKEYGRGTIVQLVRKVGGGIIGLNCQWVIMVFRFVTRDGDIYERVSTKIILGLTVKAILYSL